MSKTLSITIIILLIAYGTAISEDSFRIRPDVRPGYEVKEDRIYYRSGNAGLIIDCIQGAKAAAYFAERGASFIGNPFQNSEFAGSTIFLVTIFNRTNGNATFTPGMIAIRIKDEASFPLDFSTFKNSLESFQPHERKILDESIFHSPEIIKKGDVISKFLLFPPLPQKSIEFKLDFDYLYFEQKEVRITFYFVQERIREKQKD